jgi:flagellar hook assembly protein FlgD
VQIKSAAAVVRTLTCDLTAMKTGGVKVSWDGKDTGGVAQPAGAYTWTVVASNADGALIAADGTAAATTGTVTRT